MPISNENTRENRLINWLKFINATTKKEREMLEKTSPVLKLLNEQLNVLSLTQEEKRLCESRMKLKSDIATIYESRFNAGVQKEREEGMQRGFYDATVKNIKKMLARKMSIEAIMDITELSEDEIYNIISKE